uniref:Secreted protein n=1 Tax=Timema monikensis TaxID=170555 RepID=A0A7R9E0Q4_9NEOP|nr:unnamed protein product [Timema monikensis]
MMWATTLLALLSASCATLASPSYYGSPELSVAALQNDVRKQRCNLLRFTASGGCSFNTICAPCEVKSRSAVDQDNRSLKRDDALSHDCLLIALFCSNVTVQRRLWA